MFIMAIQAVRLVRFEDRRQFLRGLNAVNGKSSRGDLHPLKCPANGDRLFLTAFTIHMALQLSDIFDLGRNDVMQHFIMELKASDNRPAVGGMIVATNLRGVHGSTMAIAVSVGFLSIARS